MSETYRDNSQYFKMGAAVAVGELWCEGHLGEGEETASNMRAFLGSFGINSTEDLVGLGMGDTYLSDFREILPGAAS